MKLKTILISIAFVLVNYLLVLNIRNWNKARVKLIFDSGFTEDTNGSMNDLIMVDAGGTVSINTLLNKSGIGVTQEYDH